MIFRVHVAVLCAVPFSHWDKRPQAEKDLDYFDAVGSSFFVNADGASKAVALVTAAANRAVDRGGHYIGGIVIEVDCRVAPPDEWRLHQKYFYAPPEIAGIFYVSGTMSYSVAPQRISGLLPELEKLRVEISVNGLPTPSFTHPEPPEDPPIKVRLICDKCKNWIEVDSIGLMYSFMGGSHLESDERFGPRLNIAGPFIVRHIAHGGSISAFNEEDTRWAQPMQGEEEFPEDSSPSSR
jgi:hypothetical protein